MNHYTRLAILSIDDVLPYISETGSLTHKAFKVKDHIFQVGVYNKKLRTFKKSITCAKCGTTGAYFALEYEKFVDIIDLKNLKDAPAPKLQLYSIDDVLMNADHILPKSKGGSDDISNLQTMCCVCNHNKGNSK